MPALSTIVDDDTKARFLATARRLYLSESELLRAVVMVAIDQHQTGAPAIDADAGKAKTDRVRLSLPHFLMEDLRQRAKSVGMSPRRWISALIQSNLLRKPVVNDVELAALLGSNRELAAIGRNINQIARSLNQAPTERDRLTMDRLVQLRNAIIKQRAAVRELTRVSQENWKAGDDTD